MGRRCTVSAEPLYVVGAGGHAKVVAQAARAVGYEVVGLVDDNPEFHGREVAGTRVMGGTDRLPSQCDAIIAIGNNEARRQLDERLDVNWITLIHPHAVVDSTAILGAGTVVLAGCIVQAEARLGRHVIMNTASSIDHDCRVGDYVHVCPGVRLPGDVEVKSGVTLGCGAVAKPGVTIGAWATVGAGAVVVSDLPDRCVAYGVPAKPRD